MTARLHKLGLAALLLAVAPAVAAQDDADVAARRGVLERQQQSESFALQLRQSQQLNGLAPTDPARQRLEILQLEQRQQQEALQQQQRGQLSLGRSEAAMRRDRETQLSGFHAQAPTWGPVLAPKPVPATPTLAPRPASGWTPTLP